MADRTKIEWADASWNPVTGCMKVSPGCKFCYAERITERFGRKFDKVELHPERLGQPLRWKKPRRIFVNSMSDLFHEKIPDQFIFDVLKIIVAAPQHCFLVLTKRPERMAMLLPEMYKSFRYHFDPPGPETPLRNLWLGVSAENQQYADERIPWLLTTPAAVRFLSVEPLLGPVNIDGWIHDSKCADSDVPFCVCSKPHETAIDWLILGGESGGPPERALVHRCGDRIHCVGLQSSDLGPADRCGQWHPTTEALPWVRNIRDQCVASGVPFFFKQWGGPTPKSGGRLLDGGEWNDYPA